MHPSTNQTLQNQLVNLCLDFDSIIPPFRNPLKGAKIEPLSNYIPKEKLDELNKVLSDSASSQYQKDSMRRHISGSCHSCGKMPNQVVKYRIYGVTVIERYCDECLARMQT